MLSGPPASLAASIETLADLLERAVALARIAAICRRCTTANSPSEQSSYRSPGSA